MKKFGRRVASALLTGAMLIGSAYVPAIDAQAEDFTGEATLYIGFGGDKEAENDWAYQYNSPENEGNTEGITAVTETIKVGETKTVSLEFDSAVFNTWWMSPVLGDIQDATNVDATVELKIDGEAVEIDAAAGDAWWAEDTGDYTKDNGNQAIRLLGGFNEWGTQYIAEPSGFTKVEYTVTLNSVETGAAGNVALSDFDGEISAYVGFGGDKEAENDWAYQFNSPENEGNTEGITAVTETLKVGDTKTVSLEFDSPVFNVWWMAPVLGGIQDAAEVDATVELKIDGEAVEIDAAAGDAWWAEDTGDLTKDNGNQAIRLLGGFNEWGTQYIAEPSGFSKVEYTITINSVKVGTVVEEEAPAAAEVDKSGTYHAYIGFQSPMYSFRNEWADASYGAAVEDGKYFNQVTGWDATNTATTLPGSFTDAEIKGNGTYTVSATGLDFQFDDWSQDHMNLIFFSTDIPNSDDITISDVQLKVNGSNVELATASEDAPEGYIRPSLADGAQYISIQLQNIWNQAIELVGYYGTPVTDIEITFTIGGFDYDNEAAAAPTEAPAAAETTTEAAPTEAPAAEEKGGLSGGAIAGIIGGVVVLGGGAAFLATRKKNS